MKKLIVPLLLLLFGVVNVNLISFADEIVELTIKYNSSNLFIYVKPPENTTISLGTVQIVGVRRGNREILPLTLDTIYDPGIVNEITKPTCLALRIKNVEALLVGAPPGCDYQNVKNSSRIEPLNAPWIDNDNMNALETIKIRFQGTEYRCDKTDLTCIIPPPIEPTDNPTDTPEFIILPTAEYPVETPDITPSPQITPLPDNMIFIEGFDIYIDAEMASYLTWLQTIPKIVEDSWHQRVRDNEVDDLGNQYGTLLIGSPVVFSNGTPLVDYNLNWFVADVICQLQGKRLPEIEELEAALTEDGFDARPEYIEWTNTPRIREDDPDKPYFYEIWIKSEEAIDRYSDWLVVDDSRFYYRVYESLQTVDIGFRCALEKLS